MIINLNTLDLRQIKDPLIQAMLICLFTDAKVETDELPPEITYNRGCWMDNTEFTIANQKKKIKLGSKLWILFAQPLTDENADLARQFAEDALKPLVDDRKILTLYVTAERNNDRLNLLINYNNQILNIER